MTYVIHYSELVKKEDIPKLTDRVKNRIKDSIQKKLVLHPEVYSQPLRRSLKGFWKLRIGDYRVLFRIQGKKLFIEIIEHRSTVYKKLFKRLQ